MALEQPVNWNVTETLQKSIVEQKQRASQDHARLPWYALRNVSEYIARNLSEPLLTQRLAGIAGFSASHFSRCFRNSTGMTPHVYVMRQRLCEAEFLLVTSQLRLTDIALHTGFADQSHFTRRFVARTGVTPRTFRSLYR